ncbi:MAG TPA: hypothetical protein PLW65_30480, partial [Pseudomonadota bacterium]|nr:hypothetical protein [Pseudomonadota bacterium]
MLAMLGTRAALLPLSFLQGALLARALGPAGVGRYSAALVALNVLVTVLSLVAFHDLQAKIAECGGDGAQGIEAFCNQNDGEGWMLPETLRLADYGLGHDDRAKVHQPVRECFGPRFYDWQLAQSAEESWKECHLHARNLLGEEGYQKLLDEIAGRGRSESPAGEREAAGDRTL